jgi:hypothetical protein
MSISESHMYWGDPEKFDLAKMRADAGRASRGDISNEPRAVTIHKHLHGESCKGKDHEHFAPVEKGENDASVV